MLVTVSGMVSFVMPLHDMKALSAMLTMVYVTPSLVISLGTVSSPV